MGGAVCRGSERTRSPSGAGTAGERRTPTRPGGGAGANRDSPASPARHSRPEGKGMSMNPEENWTPEEYAVLCAQAEDPATPPEVLLRIEAEIDSRKDTRFELSDHLYS